MLVTPSRKTRARRSEYKIFIALLFNGLVLWNRRWCVRNERGIMLGKPY